MNLFPELFNRCQTSKKPAAKTASSARSSLSNGSARSSPIGDAMRSTSANPFVSGLRPFPLPLQSYPVAVDLFLPVNHKSAQIAANGVELPSRQLRLHGSAVPV